MKHRINFYEDWRLQLLDVLVAGGYNIDPQCDIEEVSLKYWDARRREIRTQVRTVYEPSGFVVPSGLEQSYKWLKSKIERGENINAHLSKSLLDTSKYDLMLNDWGIYHFHLNTTYETNGWINRSGPLLFAYLKGDCFYCLKIGKHGDWGDLELLRVIYNNWPSAIAQYRVTGIFSERDYGRSLLKLRKGGVTVFHQVEPGVVYVSPGGGYTSTGLSVEALMASDFHLENIRRLEIEFRNNLDYFICQFKSRGVEVSHPLEFEFVVNQAGFHVWENNLKIKIHLANEDYSKPGSAPAISIMYLSQLSQGCSSH